MFHFRWREWYFQLEELKQVRVILFSVKGNPPTPTFRLSPCTISSAFLVQPSWHKWEEMKQHFQFRNRPSGDWSWHLAGNGKDRFRNEEGFKEHVVSTPDCICPRPGTSFLIVAFLISVPEGGCIYQYSGIILESVCLELYFVSRPAKAAAGGRRVY